MKNKPVLISSLLAVMLLLGTFIFTNQENVLTSNQPNKHSNNLQSNQISDKDKINNISAYLSSLSPSSIIEDRDFVKSKFAKELLSYSKNSINFKEKVISLCDKLNDEESQHCYTEAGVALFSSNPQAISTNAELCATLPTPNVQGLNRTPNKFCGSGLFYSFFNNINTAYQANKVLPANFDFINFCTELKNASAFPCLQETGKFLAINKIFPTNKLLYHYCDPINDLYLKDQCATGVGRGMARLSTEDIGGSITNCLNLDDINYTTKCFSSFGMDNDKIKLSDVDFDKCANQNFATVTECKLGLGVFAFGQSHGEMSNLIQLCFVLKNIESYNYCMLGGYRSFIYNLKLLRDYKTPHNYTELCTLDSLYQDIGFTNLCDAALISGIQKNDLSIIDTSFISNFCQKSNESSCYQALGYLSLKLGVNKEDLKSYCPTDSCLLGYQGSLSFLDRKLKL